VCCFAVNVPAVTGVTKGVLNTVIKILRLFGVNRAVSYGLLAQVWGLGAGLITMLIIAIRFSGEQQGFYYTFSSLLALQVFFELGLVSVISTFASHEFAKLAWGEGGLLSGDPVALRRFSALLQKTSRWFGFAAILLVVGLVPVGLLFFNLKDAGPVGYSWRLPWILAVCGTACNLLVTPFFAVISGSGDVVAINRRQLIGMVVGFSISWLVIGLNGGLYAISAVSLGKAVVSWRYLYRDKPALLVLAWNGSGARKAAGRPEDTIFWSREIWPLQWKMALSWISGYFIFQLFNPVLFHYHGAVVAGQMGMTLAATNALLAASITLVNSKSPEFGKLVAVRDWQALDRLFYKVLSQSIMLVVPGALAGWGAMYLLQLYSRLGQRFIPASQAAYLLAAACIITAVYAFAVYLRAHKQEPMVLLSLVTALVQGGATWFLGKNYGSKEVALGFLCVNLLSFPFVYLIWQRCRAIWHQPDKLPAASKDLS